MKIFIKEVPTILPAQKGMFEVQECNVYIEDDIIKSVIECDKKKDTRAPFSDKTADKVISGKDRLLMPGIVNAHTHIYMNFMRGCGDDLKFDEWLNKRIFPIEDNMTEEDAYWGTKLGLLEMIESGTTSFIDMNLNMLPCGAAIEEAGLRGMISRGLVGKGIQYENQYASFRKPQGSGRLLKEIRRYPHCAGRESGSFQQPYHRSPLRTCYG